MLSRTIDLDMVKRVYADRHRVVIRDVLEPSSAEMIHASLCSHRDWELCSYGPYSSGVMPGTAADGTVSEAAYQVVRATTTTDQYAFRYYGYNLRKRLNEGLNRFLDYLSARNELFELITGLTGDGSINFVSPQATYFDAGCFLRTHNDFHAVNGVQTRKLAFVFGFTRDWPADWGGAFHVLDERGNIIDAQKPAFNTLTLFRVPTIHYVSPVAAYATGRRYAISGWFMHNPGTG